MRSLARFSISENNFIGSCDVSGLPSGITTLCLDGNPKKAGEVLEDDSARALLSFEPIDLAEMESLDLDEEDVEDALEEVLFVDQGRMAAEEQGRFDRAIAQIERFLDDRVMVLERQRRTADSPWPH